MMSPRFLIALFLIACFASFACHQKCDHHGKTAAQANHPHTTPELAAYMGALQRFSQKLGYAIQGKNKPLAAFYLHEVEETIEDVIKKIPKYDGHQIAALAKTLFEPKIKPLEESVKKQDWAAATKGYNSLIRACNLCHSAAKHAFIHVLPVSGKPPFNQRFTLPPKRPLVRPVARPKAAPKKRK